MILRYEYFMDIYVIKYKCHEFFFLIQYTDTVNNIQFQETESNNFSLNVNENR